MPALLRSLNQFVPWTEFAAVLGITTQNSALPARIDCPLCGGRLHVYEDTTKGGAWHHCFDCKSNGDLIELASRVWDTNLHATIERLACEGMPIPPEVITQERIERYTYEHRTRVRDIHDFWDACSAYAIQQQRSPVLNALLSKFCLRSEVAPQRWLRGVGKIVGAISRASIERLFCPWAEGNGNLPGHDGSARVFTGKGWTDLLVVPYQDIPERISGFFLIGRQGRTEDSLYRKTPLGHMSRLENEFGLAGLPLALDTVGDVVAIENPLIMCRIQCRHMVMSHKPLALVSWYDGHQGASMSSWRCLQGRKLIFWDWKPNHKTWLQAIRLNAHICTLGPLSENQKTLDHYIRLRSPSDHFKKFQKYARPWHEALSDLIEASSDGWTESLFCELKHDGVDPRYVAESLAEEAKQKVLRVCFGTVEHQEVVFGKNRVLERDGSWWICQGRYKMPNKLTSFLVRIDAITETGGYTGRLIVKGKEAPFFFKTRPNKYMISDTLKHLAHLHRLGVLYILPGWANKLLDIAEHFAPPRYVYDRAGGPESS